MLGSSALPTFPVDVQSGQGVEVSRQGTTFRFDLNDGTIRTAGSGALFTVATELGNTVLRAGLSVSIIANRNFTGAPQLKLDGTPTKPWLDVAGQPLARVRNGWIYRLNYDPALDAFRSTSPVLVGNDDLVPSPPNTLKGNVGGGLGDLAVDAVRALLNVDHVTNKSETELATSGPIAEALAAKATPENIASAIATVNSALATKATPQDITNAITPVANRTTAVEGSVVTINGLLATLSAGQKAGIVGAKTWAELAALTSTIDGALAEVAESDTGSHPGLASEAGATGTSVPNSGRFAWSVASSAWRRIEASISGKVQGLLNLATPVTFGGRLDFDPENRLNGGIALYLPRTLTVMRGTTIVLSTTTLGTQCAEILNRCKVAIPSGDLSTARLWYIDVTDLTNPIKVASGSIDLGGLGNIIPILAASGTGYWCPHKVERVGEGTRNIATGSPLDFGVMSYDGYARPPTSTVYVADVGSDVPFGIIDQNGYAKPVATGGGSAGVITDFSAAALAQRDNQSAAYSKAYTERANSSAARLYWKRNVSLGYGQSFSLAVEGWPAKTKTALYGNTMLGGSPRPSSQNTGIYTQFGAATLQPLIANVVSGGAILTDAQVAAMTADSPGASAFGEDPGVSHCNMLKHLWNRSKGVLNDEDHLLVYASCGLGARSVAQLSKGSSEPTNYQRLVNAATKIKAAADAANETSGLFEILWNQGEQDYTISTTKADYKAAFVQLMTDVYNDIAVGIFGQTVQPLWVIHQTGGGYTRANSNMSIGQAQLELAQEYPNVILVSPNSAVPDNGNKHLSANGYRWQGQHSAKAVFRHLKDGRHTAPFIWRAAAVGSTAVLDFCSVYGLQWAMPYQDGTAIDSPAKGFSIVDSTGGLTFTPEIIGSRTVVLHLTRPINGNLSIETGNSTFGGNTFLADTDATPALYSYDYTAGSGDFEAANISELNGKPYPLPTFAAAQFLTVSV